MKWNTAPKDLDTDLRSQELGPDMGLLDLDLKLLDLGPVDSDFRSPDTVLCDMDSDLRLVDVATGNYLLFY